MEEKKLTRISRVTASEKEEAQTESADVYTSAEM